MGPQALQLCEKLRNTGIIKDSRNATIEEQVAKFLHVLGHNVRNRTMAFFFSRSRETISRHFHVLQAIISLEAEYLVQPSGSTIPPEILTNERFYPYFKDCIGAIDETHVRAKVPREEAGRFQGCKDYPTQNVFAACSFDMKFTYVLARWEGTISYSRILKNALSREDKLIIPPGKFYLGDVGFPLKHGLIIPYRGVRYYLKEYSARSPQTVREIFNHRHASLRNVIERTFGVLKKKFPIIGSGTEPHYAFETMVDIVIACCILHNYLMGVDPDENLIAQVDHELSRNHDMDDQVASNQEDDYRQGSNLRDNIAAHMWHDYLTHMNHEL
ncbi:protein ALP1-like [Prosopis cineraria]|uniref:protein ALP1-like n=1 Tax=Prosopis cineraria TaxID=364024 RepID=UPI00240F22C6|nr:protein ALP1-like [Prosopis cineraria]